MKEITNYFSDEDKIIIENAIAHSEKHTSGEIVPVIANASGQYSGAKYIFGMLFSLLTLIIVWLSIQNFFPDEDQWGNEIVTVISLRWVLVVILLGFIIGTIIASVFPDLKLLFTSKKEMKEEVERSARVAFNQFRVRGTEGATGVLIFVSVYEQSVRVLGDDAINRKLKQQDWEEVCDLVVQGMKSNKPTEKLVGAIKLCGQLLRQHFPSEENDENELPNKLYLLD